MIGYWLDDGVLYTDEVALVYVDVQPRDFPGDMFETTLSKLPDNAFEAYAQVGSPQQEVWIEVDGIQIYRR